MRLLQEVLDKYLAVHQEMIATEQIDDDNVIVSFPLHFVGRHRVEVAVTRSANNFYVLSDMGRTIGELKQAGYTVSPALLSRMVEIAKPAEVRVVNENLIMECRPNDTGVALHVFSEIAKTIGDAYLAFSARSQPEKRLMQAVGNALNESHLAYKSDHKIAGKIEAHTVDFYIPPNGHLGLALGVLGGYNTHTTAQVWHFKCQDIRFNPRMRVGIVYDTEESNWSFKSEKILNDMADFAIPSYDLPNLSEKVKSAIRD